MEIVVVLLITVISYRCCLTWMFYPVRFWDFRRW